MTNQTGIYVELGTYMADTPGVRCTEGSSNTDTLIIENTGITLRRLEDGVDINGEFISVGKSTTKKSPFFLGINPITNMMTEYNLKNGGVYECLEDCITRVVAPRGGRMIYECVETIVIGHNFDLMYITGHIKTTRGGLIYSACYSFQSH